jgi:hypothetical protein
VLIAKGGVATTDDPCVAGGPAWTFADKTLLWAMAWATAADAGCWMVEIDRPDGRGVTAHRERMRLYGPTTAGRNRVWRLANQDPFVIAPLQDGVVLEHPERGTLAPARQSFATIRECLLHLSDLPADALAIVDTLASICSGGRATMRVSDW